MVPDATANAVAGTDVMASIDDEGAEERLVIADVSRDDAWLAVPSADAAALGEWR